MDTIETKPTLNRRRERRKTRGEGGGREEEGGGGRKKARKEEHERGRRREGEGKGIPYRARKGCPMWRYIPQVNFLRCTYYLHLLHLLHRLHHLHSLFLDRCNTRLIDCNSHQRCT